ncbi:MAG: DUF4350 domain-containing protein [Thermodesulfobacteriota bacterium]|nr:DUF4350 domain-containing protein [Thermodesulfobacteriota bacterium]
MHKRNKRLFALFFILAVFFLFGVLRLFILRFEGGDIYPAYSSLRSDPLGTRVFYESLKNQPSVSVNRNYRPFSMPNLKEKTTFFYLGAKIYKQDLYYKKNLDLFEQIAASEGRVVISFSPEKTTSRSESHHLKTENRNDGDEFGSNKKTNREASPKKEKTTDGKRCVDPDSCKIRIYRSKYITKDWGFQFGYEESHIGLGNAHPVQGLQTDTQLPPVSWHTTLYFKELSEDWRVVYTQNSHPVIIEKDLGKGTIVLSADSYFFSNEAMQKERAPKLLTWFIGENSNLVFNESHLGIRKNLGIADLARGYRLHWLFFGIVLLGGLFAWKNSAFFVPPPDDNAIINMNDLTYSRDHTEGLISILRRNIKTGDILGTCVEEWERSFVPKREASKETAEILNKIKALIDTEKVQIGKKGKPVLAYRTICQILSKRKVL